MPPSGPQPSATAGDLVVVVINDCIFPKVTSIYTLRERKQDGCPTSFTTPATAKASRNQRPMPLTFQVIPGFLSGGMMLVDNSVIRGGASDVSDSNSYNS